MPLPPNGTPATHDHIPPGRSPGALMLGADVGEYIVLDQNPDELVFTPGPDGGEYVDMPGEREESKPPDEGFYSNLAATLPDAIKNRIATELIRSIEVDKRARELRDKQYEEGIRRTGLGKDAPGGADFEGASKVVHPMLTEACIDYESRIIKEMFPPSGPVKPKIIGAVTKEKEERASRKTEHMNWQITVQIKEARSVLETLFTQVPLGGSQFLRQWWDHRLKRPRWEFAPIDKVYVPSTAADYLSAHRKTFDDRISAIEFKQRVTEGQYLDLDLPPPSMMPDPTKSETASRKVEGVEDQSENIDGDRDIYEVQTYLEVTEDAAEALGGKVEKEGDLCPYLVTIDVTSREMIAMYRNWEDGDEAREPLEHMYEFPFLPWRGAYSIGFPQIIGSLSAAATGALRALLDSAHTNNAVSGFIKKGSGLGGQSKRADIGTLVEVDIGLEATDLRQSIVLAPFNPPSAVLFQLLGFVVEAAKGVVRTSMDETPTNGPAPTPVGTQISRVEEGMVVFSAVHGRAHAAFDRLLAGLHRLNRLYLPEEMKVDAAGREILVRRQDYQGPADIQPVSDPTIYSDIQRFNQLTYIQQRMIVNPAVWNARAVELAGLKLIKWADPETLLAPAPEPTEMNAVAENMAMVLGRPVAAFPEQDHMAHLTVLVDFMSNPALGQNPLIAQSYLPAALRHAAEHIAHLYAQETGKLVDASVRDATGKGVLDILSNDVGVKQEFDRLVAGASKNVVAAVSQALQPILPVLAQVAEMVAKMMPPRPIDPAQAALQAAGAETQRKASADQAGHQLDAAELQSKTALQQQQIAVQADRNAASRENAQVAADSRLQATRMDNATAEDIAASRQTGGSGSNFSDGESLTRQ
jgi:chaperonin GroES